MNTEDDSFYEFKIAYDNPRFTAIKENGELNIIFNTINPLTSPGEGGHCIYISIFKCRGPCIRRSQRDNEQKKYYGSRINMIIELKNIERV